MIYLGSRYATQKVRAVLGTTGAVRQFVMRLVVPGDARSSLPTYVWRDGDRIDRVAEDLIGSAKAWHLIMDLNPELSDPGALKPGDVLRYPSSGQ